jgi:hypothetical protein
VRARRRSRLELTIEVVHLLVDRLFASAERTAALALLEDYGTAPHEREVMRVRVAVLKLSDGRLPELERLIASARQDYRDVLAWAEYPAELVQPTWRLPEPDVARIRAADRAQYLAWLAAHTAPHSGAGSTVRQHREVADG